MFRLQSNREGSPRRVLLDQQRKRAHPWAVTAPQRSQLEAIKAGYARVERHGPPLHHHRQF